MPRYIDANKMVSKDNAYTTFPHDLAGCDDNDLVRWINEQPTADVVPKSEIVNILDGLMKEAREIADRYEKSANETSDYDYARIEYRGCQMGALLVLFKIAELKKKYTESEKEK